MIVMFALIFVIWLLDLYYDGITPALQEVERERGGLVAFYEALWVLTW